MSNVIHLNMPVFRQSLTRRLAGLIHCFASERRFGDDVYWLKENAELLSILETSGHKPGGEALAPLQGFYDEVFDRMSFFPQYYRFLLSITLDLEDLGLTGGKGAELVEWAAQSGLAEAELSDLQRAEARRLMLRRGRDPLPGDIGLSDRLRDFARRADTFALPNKKAAYELTHIVFYLSEYGRRDPGLDDGIFLSLNHAGTLAYLDQNIDVLAEICLALRYAGQTPPDLWEGLIRREAAQFSMTEGPDARIYDNYHEFFVCNWVLATMGEESFRTAPNFCRAQFKRGPAWVGPLRRMSQCLFDMGAVRSDRWDQMRDQVAEALDDDGRDILVEAEESSASFDAFFRVFARAAQVGLAPRRSALA